MLAHRLDFAAKTIPNEGKKSQRCKIERAYTFCGQSKHKIDVNSLFSIRKNGIYVSHPNSHSSEESQA